MPLVYTCCFWQLRLTLQAVSVLAVSHRCGDANYLALKGGLRPIMRFAPTCYGRRPEHGVESYVSYGWLLHTARCPVVVVDDTGLSY